MATNSVWGSWMSISKPLNPSSVLGVRVGLDVCFHGFSSHGFSLVVGRGTGLCLVCDLRWFGACVSENYVGNTCKREKAPLVEVLARNIGAEGVKNCSDSQSWYWRSTGGSQAQQHWPCISPGLSTSHGNSKPGLKVEKLCVPTKTALTAFKIIELFSVCCYLFKPTYTFWTIKKIQLWHWICCFCWHFACGHM